DAGGLIPFACQECGRSVLARAVNSGRKVQCPDCGTLQTIPSGNANAAAQAHRATPWQTRQHEADWPAEDEDGPSGPRRNRRKKGTSPWLWLGAGASLALAAFAVWFLLLRGGRGNVAAEFDLVPRDAQGFMT